jgi:uroporphyrin-III C-methyltransferase
MTRVATSSAGRVAFVGAGPGQADLITVRGALRLQEADVVLFDSLADPALRALAPNARWIDVGKRGFSGVPHAPRGGRENTGQDTINALLVKHAQRGATVVRLKGGDPSVFGRLEEELEALAAAGIACEVVPGVTAALAAAAATQRPLTRRGAGRSVALTTAMTNSGALTAGRHADTESFYMAGKQLAALSRRLVEAGWPAAAPALVVSRAGWPDQIASEHSVATLGDATVLHSGRPTIVTIGVGAVAVGEAEQRVDDARRAKPATATGTAPAVAAAASRHAEAGTSTP